MAYFIQKPPPKYDDPWRAGARPGRMLFPSYVALAMKKTSDFAEMIYAMQTKQQFPVRDSENG